MKDSQPSTPQAAQQDKYIKANNERFSTRAGNASQNL